MAYDEKLADRIRELLAASGRLAEEKKMFGGLCFMVNDKMCVGIMKDELMCRIDPATYEEAVNRPECREMRFTGRRAMKGIVLVNPAELKSRANWQYWIDRCLAYNPMAKPSRKRTS